MTQEAQARGVQEKRWSWTCNSRPANTSGGKLAMSAGIRPRRATGAPKSGAFRLDPWPECGYKLGFSE
jgi:hypothetical protein